MFVCLFVCLFCVVFLLLLLLLLFLFVRLFVFVCFVLFCLFVLFYLHHTEHKTLHGTDVLHGNGPKVWPSRFAWQTDQKTSGLCRKHSTKVTAQRLLVTRNTSDNQMWQTALTRALNLDSNRRARHRTLSTAVD